MKVTSRRYASAAVLQVSGRLDQDTCEAFRAELVGDIDQAARHGDGVVVLDLAALEYVSSAGLRCFMVAAREARERNVRLCVAAPQPMVREIFEISHFNLLLQVFPTVHEALAAASAEAAAAYARQ